MPRTAYEPALANSGSIANLAATGADLREAWLATGMAEPHVMASATWGIPPGARWRARVAATGRSYGLSGLPSVAVGLLALGGSGGNPVWP